MSNYFSHIDLEVETEDSSALDPSESNKEGEPSVSVSSESIKEGKPFLRAENPRNCRWMRKALVRSRSLQ